MNNISTLGQDFLNTNELNVPITDHSGNIGSHDGNAKKPAGTNPLT